MSHYSEEELILYSEACVDELLEKDIEEHLLICGKCRDRYIQIVEYYHRSDCVNKISTEFTDNVMKSIKADNSRNKVRKKKRVAPEVFLYYVAAACITLLFSYNGILDSLVSGFSDMTTSIAKTPVSMEQRMSNGWTERLAEDTSTLISQLKPQIIEKE
jgi:predicted anti-sigma-YlaC factor YlaD